jgi:hypothetical protein
MLSLIYSQSILTISNEYFKFNRCRCQKQFVTDSITLIASSNAEYNSLVFQSPFLNANVTGKYKLSKIGDAITNSIGELLFTWNAFKRVCRKSILKF